MTDNHPATPFGRRTLTLAMVASQAAAKACPEDRVVHKWKIFRAITDARDRLDISDRALTVLNASDPLQIAQATQPTQSTPGAETKPSSPSEPATTGQRPSDIPPQPARPDPDAQKAGAQPALPPAPAEKIAPPIREK